MPDPLLELRPPADVVTSSDSAAWARALTANPAVMRDQAALEFWCRSMIAQGAYCRPAGDATVSEGTQLLSFLFFLGWGTVAFVGGWIISVLFNLAGDNAANKAEIAALKADSTASNPAERAQTRHNARSPGGGF